MKKKNQCIKTGPGLIQMSEITNKGIKNSYHSYILIIKKNKEKYRVYKNKLNQAYENKNYSTWNEKYIG